MAIREWCVDARRRRYWNSLSIEMEEGLEAVI